MREFRVDVANIRRTRTDATRRDHLPGAELESVDLSLCYCRSLRLASKRLLKLYGEALAPCGLQPVSYALLTMLSQRGPIPLNDLGEGMHLDRSGLRYRLKPLLDDVLVTLSADPRDRRSRRVSLTAAGARKLAEAAPLWRQAQARFESTMGEVAAASLRSEALLVAKASFAESFDRSA